MPEFHTHKPIAMQKEICAQNNENVLLMEYMKNAYMCAHDRPNYRS